MADRRPFNVSRVPPSRSEKSDMKVLIVCPTGKGGHIEHAANLGVALANNGHSVVILSRPGSRNYLPEDIAGMLTVREGLRPLADSRGLRRVINRVAVLAHEHRAIRSAVS